MVSVELCTLADTIPQYTRNNPVKGPVCMWYTTCVFHGPGPINMQMDPSLLLMDCLYADA